MKLIISSALVIFSLISLPAQAALVKFDVGSLFGFFSTTPLSGSFVLDTSDQSLSQVNLMSGAGAFDTGSAIDNAGGFGLQQTTFFFQGAAELVFEITGFDRFMPSLAQGESINVDAFVNQADQFNDNFQNVDPFSPNTDIFQGSILATRLNEVPVPAGLSFLAVLIGGVFFIRRQQANKNR
jgi:hypothetical protein